MSPTAIFFVAVAAILLGLLALAARTPESSSRSPQELLQLLSTRRHFERLPQIEQAMARQDFEHLRSRGCSRAARHLKTRRRRLLLTYVDQLDEEFACLLEASRLLAVMAPSNVDLGQAERFKRAAVFAIRCAYVRLMLRAGTLNSAQLLRLSTMSSDISRHLDAAIQAIAQGSLMDGGVTEANNLNL